MKDLHILIDHCNLDFGIFSFCCVDHNTLDNWVGVLTIVLVHLEGLHSCMPLAILQWFPSQHNNLLPIRNFQANRLVKSIWSHLLDNYFQNGSNFLRSLAMNGWILSCQSMTITYSGVMLTIYLSLLNVGWKSFWMDCLRSK